MSTTPVPPQPPMTPVVSSSLMAVGYDETNLILYVQFTSGKVYSYHNVPKEKYEALLTAPSVGSYFAKHIKHSLEGGKQ